MLNGPCIVWHDVETSIIQEDSHFVHVGDKTRLDNRVLDLRVRYFSAVGIRDVSVAIAVAGISGDIPHPCWYLQALS
jgi:hypothetical protein